MIEIHATPITTIGRYRVMRVTAAGEATTRTKDGDVPALFYAGDIIVTDEAGHVVIAPIGLAGGVAIATEIMEARSRVITDPLLHLKLAAVILGYAMPDTGAASLESPTSEETNG